MSTPKEDPPVYQTGDLSAPPTGDRPDYPIDNPPYKSELTVIWAEEKAELHQRIEELQERVSVIEAWAAQLKRQPTAFTSPEEL